MPRPISMWHVRFRCPECRKMYRASFDSPFFLFGGEKICPECGQRHVDEFERVVVRFVSTAIPWKPWTWFSGRWEHGGDYNPLTGDRMEME